MPAERSARWRLRGRTPERRGRRLQVRTALAFAVQARVARREILRGHHAPVGPARTTEASPQDDRDLSTTPLPPSSANACCGGRRTLRCPRGVLALRRRRPPDPLGLGIEEAAVMSHPSALDKLSRAARLSAEAARLCAEALADLSERDKAETVPPVSEVDQARARRALRKAGLRL